MDLDVLVCRIKVQSLAPVSLPHVLTARQLHIKLHLRQSNIRLALQIPKQIRRVQRLHALTSRRSRSGIIRNPTASRDTHIAALERADVVSVRPLLEQLHLSRGLHPVDSFAAAEVLDILRDQHFDAMALHLRQGSELESDRDFGAEREALAGYDDVVV